MTEPPAPVADTTGRVHSVRARDGVRLHVVDEGDGPPVLLLHGFPDSLGLWDEVAARLVGQGRRVIRYDMRGFGGSDAPEARAAYRIEQVVDDAWAVLDARGVRGPVDVVGHDWGSMISWCLCLAAPERVRRHVAISCGHPSAYRSAGLEQKRKGLYVLGFQVPGLAERVLTRDDGALLERWGRGDLDRATIDAVCRPGRMTAGLNYYRANVLAIFTRRWPACRVPTLGVQGTADPFLSVDQMARSARWMAADWRMETVGGRHWLPREDPDLVSRLVADWSGIGHTVRT